MKRISEIDQVRRLCDEARRAGKRVALVPTMGYLHRGHVALVERAVEMADFTVVSIFVNPTQFGPGEDLDSYPVDLERDMANCQEAGADLIFTPPPGAMYSEGFQTYVRVEELSKPLCGKSRPIHFRGVATVVTKLFNIIGPCAAVFGQKDYQQLQVIKRMVLDMDQPVQVVGHPTVREADGLAMSSRNAYLTEEERRAAPCLIRALEGIRDRAAEAGGELPADQALALARGIIDSAPGTRIDYIEARDADTLEEIHLVGGGRSVVAMAVFLGKARLIDNMVI